MTLHDYQIEPVLFLSRNRKALLHAPAGSGKTVIGAAALARIWGLVQVQGPIIWLANTIEQVNQAKAALRLFLGDAAERVQVCCWQSYPDTSNAAVLICDECHHCHLTDYGRMVKACPGRVWGLSATPFCSDPERDDVVRELFGKPFIVKREALVEAGKLAHGKVRMLTVNQPNEFHQLIADTSAPEIEKRCQRLKFLGTGKPYEMKCAEAKQRVTWQTCLDIGILNNAKRNTASIERATVHVLNEDSVLVLVNQVVHAESLAGAIPGAVAVFSKLGAKKRREALAGFAAGTIPCIIATSLADEGMDVPRANVLVLVSAGRSSNKLEQRTGRVLRSFQGKSHGMIYDFTDDWHYMGKAQAKSRMNTYTRLGYEVEQFAGGAPCARAEKENQP